jgi:hypothetical protein
MKVLFPLLFFFCLTFTLSAQDRIDLSQKDSDSLSKGLAQYRLQKDSLEYFTNLESFLQEQKRRLRLDIALKETVLEFYIQDIINTYKVPKEFVFGQEDDKLFFRRKTDGDTSGS